MAPQTGIPVAANVLGTIGTVFWCIQLVPQVWYNWKMKKTDGLPGSMMFIWAASAVPFGVYAIVQNFNIPIQIQPQVFCMLALVNWAQVLVYNNAWRAWTASLLATGIGVLFGGLEVLLILTLRGPYDRGIEWPVILIGVIAAILLGGGLLPPYFELWRRHGRVIGINWFFISIDWLGAFFSLFALVAQHTFDYLGGIMYIVCLLLELGIMTSHVIWRIRTRKLHARAKSEGIDFDDLPEAIKYQRPRDRAVKHSDEELELGNAIRTVGMADTQHAERPINLGIEVEARESIIVEAPRSGIMRKFRFQRSKPIQPKEATTLT